MTVTAPVLVTVMLMVDQKYVPVLSLATTVTRRAPGGIGKVVSTLLAAT